MSRILIAMLALALMFSLCGLNAFAADDKPADNAGKKAEGAKTEQAAANPAPANNGPTEVKHWVDALIAMNQGRFDEAEKYLLSVKLDDPHYWDYVKALLDDLKKIRNMDTWGKEQKYDLINGVLGEFQRLPRYPGVLAIYRAKMKQAKETGKWPEGEVKPVPAVPRINLSIEDCFDLLAIGKYEEAKRLMLVATQDKMSLGIIAKIDILMAVKQLCIEGKFAEAKKKFEEITTSSVANRYAGAIQYMNAAMEKCKQDKKWPEK